MTQPFTPYQFKFHGKTYETAPDEDDISSCQRCAMRSLNMCAFTPPGDGGVRDCLQGMHYYIEVQPA